MAIGEDGWRYSQLAGCVARANVYHLTEPAARELIDRQVDAINANWDAVCEEAELTKAQRDSLLGRQFLNPFAFQDSHS